ncbi:SDR family oxidoreductase [Rhodobacter sp. NTK016B]|uniref:SDR family oxidoreductase n=1 Tax=Rhodobacter sp. NTK016B TaxID=2759676 RepID=UPI001A8D0751|nr:SDR family oxidoreductase [Rhodobacter sp. NTK016B]MBN8291244.1 SDR family oxidoreductase [Rhodobacter sp. NTK016B]
MPRAFVLGGYGLIGAACCRALAQAGYAVTAVGRSRAAAAQSGLAVDWLFRDLVTTDAATWRADLADADVVVNAAGALQDGPRDDLDGVHDRALGALIDGLGDSATRFVQISAAGVSPDSPTAFFRSKARGDARLMASGLDWIILRPTLVLAPAAYGGTALLRAAAAAPLLHFRVFPDAPVQTVALADLAQAVVTAAQGGIPRQRIYDLTEAESRSFAATTEQMRAWLGLPPWRTALTLPEPLARLTGRFADGLGRLGWRGPLRTNALVSLRDGITGDPAAWQAAGGAPCKNFEATLAAMPATPQDRWFARMYLLLPLAIGVLALFWMASGLIALAQPQRSAEVLTLRGMAPGPAMAIALIGGVFDVALGLAILWRRWARRAAMGMIAVAGSYLLGSLIVAPDLWLDPMGPMVKVLPALPLALIVASLIEPR